MEQKDLSIYLKAGGTSSSGTLRVGESRYSFEADSAFSCLDFGRGKWPYNISWNWANASGIVNGRSFGLNLGAMDRQYRNERKRNSF